MTTQASSLRIIAGKWRRRRLPFPGIEGLRPTPDRVRETLFNCLMPYVQQANCLDLFAGSGALGFEALSRGASKVTFIDQSVKVTTQLKQNCQQLGTDQANIICANALNYLQTACLQIDKAPAFDIIFIDPPFHQGLANQSCQLLCDSKYLTQPTYLYIEVERDFDPTQLPNSWQLIKKQTIGQLCFYLMKSK